MPTVTISATNYDVYADTTTATSYVTAMIGGDATSWLAATADDKARTLVSATRMLDRQDWSGTKTDSAQALDWPRTGVVDADGIAVDSATVPDAVVDASIELAVALLANPDLQAAQSGGKSVRRVDAKGVSVEFFAPESFGRFPTVVQELVGAFLSANASGVGVPVVSGATSCSTFNRDPDGDGDDDGSEYDLGNGL